MAQKSTRQRILDLLSIQGRASTAELSRAISVTQADIRYHISRMVKEGLVVPVKPKQSGRRGRPSRRYQLAIKSKQDNYDILVRALLTMMRVNGSREELEDLLARIAKQIPGKFMPGGPLGQRLVQAVEQLNMLDYQARWEAHVSEPKIIFENCPFATLRPDFPEICTVDINLLVNLLGEKVLQVESSAHLSNGFCQFNISPKNLSAR
jgi:predicted ArsR family transcriptional regulator